MNVLIESFGNWANNENGALGKWSVSTLPAGANALPTSGRRGGPALVINPSGSIQNFALVKNITPTSNGFMGGAFKISAVPSQNIFSIMWAGNSSGPILSLGINQTGQIVIQQGGSYSSQIGNNLATSVATFAANTYQYLEWSFSINSANAGAFSVFLNNTAIIQISGVNTSIVNTFSNFQLGINGYNVNTPVANVFIADVYLNNSSGSFNNGLWGDTAIDCFHPNGNTAVTNFAPLTANNWYEVSEVDQDGDTSYNYDANPGDSDLFTKPVSSANVGVIKVVQLVSVAKTDVSGSRIHANILQSGNTIAVGANNSLGTNYLQYVDTFETDPNTGSPWLKTNFDSANIGYKVVA